MMKPELAERIVSTLEKRIVRSEQLPSHAIMISGALNPGDPGWYIFDDATFKLAGKDRLTNVTADTYAVNVVSLATPLQMRQNGLQWRPGVLRFKSVSFDGQSVPDRFTVQKNGKAVELGSDKFRFSIFQSLDCKDTDLRFKECFYGSILLRARYDWTVGFSLEGGMQVRFPTTPEAAREALKLRDLPVGAKRRPALLHWVQGYRRVDTDVREHLRGKTQFQLDGWSVEILPSPFDAEKAIRPDLLV